MNNVYCELYTNYHLYINQNNNYYYSLYFNIIYLQIYLQFFLLHELFLTIELSPL